MSKCPTLGELPPPPPGKKGWPWTEESERLPDMMPDGSPWPRISIVTPSYDQARFIEETIRAVLLQGYPELEYIIIDGGSTDDSVEIIKKYEKWLAYWVSEPDQGQSHAINKGFERASGHLYSWLNSDDYLVEGALNDIALAYHAAPTAGAWCGACECIDATGKRMYIRWPKRLDAEGLARWNENSIGQPACFFSAGSWQRCGPLDEALHYGMDLDFWLRLAKVYLIERVPHEIAVERDHPEAKTGRDRGKMYAFQCLIQFRHGYEQQAIEDIAHWMNDYLSLKKRIDALFRLPLARHVLAPVARKILARISVH